VGAGRSQEAEYLLRGDLAAGAWRLVGDGIISQAVDVRFEVFVRRADTTEVPLVMWDHHFEPLGGGNFDAQPYEVTANGPAVDVGDGDQLILRYTGTGSAFEMAYQPNGDGPRAKGRIPFLELP
jgi:hypothetical protein